MSHEALRRLNVYDVAIGDDGAVRLLDCEPDAVGVNRCLITLFDRSSVDGEGVDSVSFKDFQKLGELIMTIEFNPCFDGEFPRNGFAQC